MGEHVSIVEGPMAEVTAQHLARNAKSVAKKTTLKLYVKVVMETQIDVTQVSQDPKGQESQREKNHEVIKDQNNNDNG